MADPSAYDVLANMSYESLIVYQCSNILRRGEALNDVDHARLVTAASRLGTAYTIAADGI